MTASPPPPPHCVLCERLLKRWEPTAASVLADWLEKRIEVLLTNPTAVTVRARLSARAFVLDPH